jgi:hypothetical protein
MFSRALCKLAIPFFLLGLPLTVSLCFGDFAKAAEKEGEKEKPAEKEKSGEGGKEAGKEGGKEKDELSGSQKKQADEATELQAKVQALQAKVRTKDENIRKLIEEKNETKDAAKVKEIIQQMVTEHKEMNTLIQEYEQNRSLLRYRYPEKGIHGARTYERMEAKPLEQIENQLSVEAKLNRTLKTVKSQYGEPAPDPKRKAKKVEKNLAPSLTEPIVIQK